MPTFVQQLLDLVAASPGFTDRELTDRLKGRDAPQQHANHVCRRLEKANRLRRDRRPDGLIGNYPAETINSPKKTVRAPPSLPQKTRPSTTNRSGGFSGTTRISVNIEWSSAGEVRWDDNGKPIFPSLQAAPGLYRLRFAATREVYIGETVNLKRRAGNYRNPGSTQQTSTWVNERLNVAREANEVVLVETSDHAFVVVRGATIAADLTTKPVRLLLENAALLDESQSGWRILNRQA